VERATLEDIAAEYDTTIEVGSRGGGAGRNIETELPFGKGAGTRSDIDLTVSSILILAVDLATLSIIVFPEPT
jgi:hypothetical protein